MDATESKAASPAGGQEPESKANAAAVPAKPKQKAVRLDVGATATQEGESLQDRFKRFRQQRAKALRANAERKAKERANPKFCEKLRKKFVETAMKYQGVPYAQKYHEPGTESYNAPLFLDCCGLVRKVMDDLQEDFGFRIGRWNQAYMFDTLPKEVALEDMKPGDLIFYSGIYTRKNAKPQKHNMVHVEIFLGGETGEATLGARWQKGRCKVFDTFRFKSKNYHSIQYYYRSLDTWLEGECKSHCDEHPWIVQGFQNVDSAKSVFYQQAAESGDMECDSEDDDGADESKDNTVSSAGAENVAPLAGASTTKAGKPSVTAAQAPAPAEPLGEAAVST